MWQDRLKNWATSQEAQFHDLAGVTMETVPLLLLRATRDFETPVLAVLNDSSEAERAAAAASAWSRLLDLDRKILYLPEPIRSGNLYMPGNEAARAKVLHQTLSGDPMLIFAGAEAVISKTPAPDSIKSSEMIIETGDTPGFSELIETLVKMDYDDEFEVTVPGEFSRRGGIIDVWSPDCDHPVRIEFWGDQIDSMRYFNPNDQRSTGTINEYRLISRSSLDYSEEGCDFLGCADSVDAFIVIVDPVKLEMHVDKYLGCDSSARSYCPK